MTPIRRIFCFLTLAMICGCSTFTRDYEKTAAQAAPATAPALSHHAISGAWEGTWQSNGGHGSGRLYAIVNQKANSSEYPVYHVRFRAHFWGMLKTEYEIILRQVTSEPLKFKGEHDLGLLAGGVYEYEATVTRENFDATYKSGGDHGVFKMTRPK